MKTQRVDLTVSKSGIYEVVRRLEIPLQNPTNTLPAVKAVMPDISASSLENFFLFTRKLFPPNSRKKGSCGHFPSAMGKVAQDPRCRKWDTCVPERKNNDGRNPQKVASVVVKRERVCVRRIGYSSPLPVPPPSDPLVSVEPPVVLPPVVLPPSFSPVSVSCVSGTSTVPSSALVTRFTS